ncbi:hypothetical protein CEXT_21861 [Caerostris extrusa]|uniref:Uncharacterized protein n=1 Tax=Caerostris extrusa TaxID=172846 RepID=A0AAV4MUU9_CAEEX|nr:hypothetical protein CEXT_21861 [Caerostris extrusa]
MHVGAFVDTGSQLSYLSTRVIKELALKPKRRQRLVHALFGRNTEPHLHEIYEIATLQGSFFGVMSSPFLLMASLHYLSESAPKEYSALVLSYGTHFMLITVFQGVSCVEEMGEFYNSVPEIDDECML